MRLVAENPETGALECSVGDTSTDDCSDGAVVVVAVKLDTRSKELLTWALVKVAQSGDRVIALHILDPDAGEKFYCIIPAQNIPNMFFLLFAPNGIAFSTYQLSLSGFSLCSVICC